MYNVRKASVEDCQLIHEMALDVFPATYRRILSKSQIDYMMHWMYDVDNIRHQMVDEHHVYFIISGEDHLPLGYFSVEQQADDLFHLQKIYVLPQYQGRGLGEFMFKEAIAYIKSIHPEPCSMELNVNRDNPALKFYYRMGMQKLREGDFDIGNGYFMNDYIMGIEI